MKKNAKATKPRSARTGVVTEQDLAAVEGGTNGTIISENATDRTIISENAVISFGHRWS